ncbi:conjugal transfer protein [Streptococcus iniae]|uniref:conjugal transfer protein n=1 Tax=Streptococcus iniae TaxID=1346 RepID=UPI000EF6BED7|nr:conjugal transfer protein [Streptococcus iniae]RLU51371.1 conjugal transfer protein [Streptococcus iniae]RLU59985.1 conjugal transfer protein [Streptococcus iniae]RLU62796.1 conjugal transfer protein [Streptococcus iniae]RLU72522.1 conjugal transfer protein [Streptococcus iniae]RLU82201.1 conjugal transfer protein [Streptococcus iniae]
MVIKKIYEGITCFPETNTFWNLYIVLTKEKDFFLDAFARETVDLDYPAKYQHAYFTIDCQILDLNRNMDTKLVTLFREIILEKQTDFMEEILMANQSLIEKKIKATSLELGELMKAHNDKEAWTKAGELNHLLKNEEAEKLAPELLEQIRAELRGYYYVNGEINKLHKQLYAKGNKLIELASA